MKMMMMMKMMMTTTTLTMSIRATTGPAASREGDGRGGRRQSRRHFCSRRLFVVQTLVKARDEL